MLALLGPRRKPRPHRRPDGGAERMTDKTVDAQRRAGDFDYPVLDGSVGPEVVDIRKLYAETGMFTYDPGLHLDRELRERDHLHRRREGHPAPPRLSDRPAGREFDLHGGRLPAAPRRASEARTSSTSSPTRSAATRCCTSSSRPSIAASAATRTRWRSCAAWSARSSAFYHDSTDITDPEQRMIASHRLIAKMPTIAAMAYKYSIGQPFLYPAEQPQLHRQLPAHDLRRPGRAL